MIESFKWCFKKAKTESLVSIISIVLFFWGIGICIALLGNLYALSLIPCSTILLCWIFKRLHKYGMMIEKMNGETRKNAFNSESEIIQISHEDLMKIKKQGFLKIKGKPIIQLENLINSEEFD